MTPIDEAWKLAREGSHGGFTSWVSFCEPQLRRSLRSFARAVDVEAIVNEGLTRMWVLAPTLRLSGEDASLKFALRLVRNLAISEARRNGRTVPIDDLGNHPEEVVAPDPPSDPGLRRVLQRCLERLPGTARKALEARRTGRPDRESAEKLTMRINTFLQNVTRGRRALAECLERNGVRVQEYLR